MVVVECVCVGKGVGEGEDEEERGRGAGERKGRLWGLFQRLVGPSGVGKNITIPLTDRSLPPRPPRASSAPSPLCSHFDLPSVPSLPLLLLLLSALCSSSMVLHDATSSLNLNPPPWCCRSFPSPFGRCCFSHLAERCCVSPPSFESCCRSPPHFPLLLGVGVAPLQEGRPTPIRRVKEKEEKYGSPNTAARPERSRGKNSTSLQEGRSPPKRRVE